MQKNYKNLLKEIYKIAAPRAAKGSTPVGGSKAPSKSSSSSSSSSKSSGTTDDKIKKMQDAIIDLGTTLNTGPNAKDFKDFFAEQYSAEALIHGKEYDPNASPQQLGSGETEITEFTETFSQLGRIGSAIKENKEDGIWGFRTQNALKLIWSLADSLLKIVDDFGQRALSKKFTQADLNKLGQLIPIVEPEDIDRVKPEYKTRASQAITPILKKIEEFYKDYSANILDNPEYKKYIKGTSAKGATTYEPLFNAPVGSGSIDEGVIPPQLQEANKNLTIQILENVSVPSATGTTTLPKVAVSEFKDISSLKRLMFSKLGYNESQMNDLALQKVVIDALLSSARLQAGQTATARPPSAAQTTSPR